MKEISRRLRKLEVSHAAQRNAQGLNLADVLRQRMCRYEAEETAPLETVFTPDAAR
jgi:hypothetical protein